MSLEKLKSAGLLGSENCVAQQLKKSMKDKSDREIAIFSEALKLPPREREGFLQRSCAGDHDLRSKVEALLRAHGRLGKFMEEPPQGPID